MLCARSAGCAGENLIHCRILKLKVSNSSDKLIDVETWKDWSDQEMIIYSLRSLNNQSYSQVENLNFSSCFHASMKNNQNSSSTWLNFCRLFNPNSQKTAYREFDKRFTSVVGNYTIFFTTIIVPEKYRGWKYFVIFFFLTSINLEFSSIFLQSERDRWREKEEHLPWWRDKFKATNWLSNHTGSLSEGEAISRSEGVSPSVDEGMVRSMSVALFLVLMSADQGSCSYWSE